MTFLLKLFSTVLNWLYFIVDHWSSFTRMQDIHAFHNHINIIFFYLSMSVFMAWFKHEQVGHQDITLRRFHWLDHRRTGRGFSLWMYVKRLIVGWMHYVNVGSETCQRWPHLDKPHASWFIRKLFVTNCNNLQAILYANLNMENLYATTH